MPGIAPQPKCVIGDSTLDLDRGVVLRGGELVRLRAKTYALLCHLAAHRGRVVAKDELIEAIWPDVIVSEDSLTQCVRDLRRALRDDEQRWIKTVSRRGYLLAVEPEAALQLPVRKASETAEPRVAVLPFAFADGLDQVLIDGIAEEITNGLARFRTVVVIARASAFAFPVAGRPPAEEIGARLSADHLVEGTVRRSGDAYRIAVSLTHAPATRQIWGEQFLCSEEELAGIDAVISRRIIGQLVTSIEDSMLRRIAAAPPSSLRAFEYWLRGKMFLRGYDRLDNANALQCLRSAIDIDPGFGLAQAYLALAEVIDAGYALAPRPVLEEARQRASRAVTLAPDESRCHRILGLLTLYLGDHAAAESQMRRAVDLNPCDADALAQMGFVLTMRGHPEQALPWLERAMALNPFHPPWYDSDMVFTLFLLGRYGEAAEVESRIPEQGLIKELRRTAVAAMSGDMDKATRHLADAIGKSNGRDLAQFAGGFQPFEHDRDRQRFLDGIRRAQQALREQRSQVAD